MDAETTEAVRHAGNLQNIINQHRILLEKRPKNADGKDHLLEFPCKIISDTIFIEKN